MIVAGMFGVKVAQRRDLVQGLAKAMIISGQNRVHGQDQTSLEQILWPFAKLDVVHLFLLTHSQCSVISFYNISIVISNRWLTIVTIVIKSISPGHLTRKYFRSRRKETEAITSEVMWIKTSHFAPKPVVLQIIKIGNIADNIFVYCIRTAICDIIHFKIT